MVHNIKLAGRDDRPTHLGFVLGSYSDEKICNRLTTTIGAKLGHSDWIFLVDKCRHPHESRCFVTVYDILHRHLISLHGLKTSRNKHTLAQSLAPPGHNADALLWGGERFPPHSQCVKCHDPESLPMCVGFNEEKWAGFHILDLS